MSMAQPSLNGRDFRALSLRIGQSLPAGIPTIWDRLTTVSRPGVALARASSLRGVGQAGGGMDQR